MVATVYAFGGVKGGVGKTTLSLNTASVLSNMGKRVIVLDTDDQNGVGKLVAYRSGQPIKQFNSPQLLWNKEAPAFIAETIQRFAEDYDAVIVDCPPGKSQPALKSALVVSDILITPIAPSIIDKNAMEQMDTLVGESRVLNPELKALMVINNTEFGPKEDYTQSLRDSLSEFAQYTIMQCQIGDRRPFKYAAMLGRSVMEYEDRADRVAKAREELNEFIVELLNHG
jgi:chromosome partitioning protein